MLIGQFYTRETQSLNLTLKKAVLNVNQVDGNQWSALNKTGIERCNKRLHAEHQTYINAEKSIQCNQSTLLR